MLVKELMAKEVITVKRSTKLKELLNLFNKFHLFPLVPVIEEDGRLVGIVSFRNLIDVFSVYRQEILKTVPFLDEQEENIFKVKLAKGLGDLIIVEDIMETKFISLKEDTTLEEAFKLMKLYLKEELPVVDRSERLVGMIGIFDIVREIFRQNEII